MKVLHLNYAQGDGAGNAVERIHAALLKSGIDSRFMYLRPHDPSVSPLTAFGKKINGLANRLAVPFTGGSPVEGFPSLNVFPSKVLDAVNHSDADVVHLHWVNGEMMSIAQIARITKPVVWTFHSMWPFLGMYHWDSSQPSGALQQWVDRWTYGRKKKWWQQLQCRVVCPSRWMALCAKKSELFGRFPVSVIANCLDTDMFKPMSDQLELRKMFNLPADKKILLFGATQPGALRKGGDLIEAILKGLMDPEKFALAVFGTKAPRRVPASETAYGLDTYELGFIKSPETMAALYNAADVVCVPSRQDNLPSVCLEAQACSRPVVAFDVGGLPDMIVHKESGYLVRENDTADFRAGILWALTCTDAECRLMRERISSTFGMDTVSRLHVAEYQRAVENEQ